jgi:tetratricopeptide (TPR) repeat protein
MLSLIAVLIGVVSFLSYKRPEALKGIRSHPSPSKDESVAALRPSTLLDNRTEVDFLKAFLTIFSPNLSPGDQYSKIVKAHFSKLQEQLQRLENDEDWSSLISIKERLREYFEYSGQYKDGVEFGKVYVRALRHLKRDLEAAWAKVKDVGYLLVLDGKHDEGRKFLNETLSDLEFIEDDLKGECYFYCFRYLGISYLRDEDFGDIDRAKEYFSKAEGCIDMLRSYPKKQKPLNARILGNQGNISLVEGRHEEAIQYYEKSYKLFRELGDKEHIGIAKLQCAQSIMSRKNHIDSVPSHLSEAKAMFIDIGWLEGMARVTEQYARYYELLAHRVSGDEAYQYLVRARDAVSESKKLYERVGVERHIGRVHEISNRLSQLENDLSTRPRG